MLAEIAHRVQGMSGRLAVLIVTLVTAALLGGIALASFIPSLSQRVLAIAAFATRESPAAPEPSERKAAVDATGVQQDTIRLSEGEIEAAGIALAAAEGGAIAHRVVVPGTIVPHADRIAHIAHIDQAAE